MPPEARDPVTGKESVVFTCFNQDQDLDAVDFAQPARAAARQLDAGEAQQRVARRAPQGGAGRHPRMSRSGHPNREALARPSTARSGGGGRVGGARARVVRRGSRRRSSGVAVCAVAPEPRRAIARNLRRVRGRRGAAARGRRRRRGRSRPTRRAWPRSSARRRRSGACPRPSCGASACRGRARARPRASCFATAHTAGWEAVGPLLARDRRLRRDDRRGGRARRRGAARSRTRRAGHSGLHVAHVGDDPLSRCRSCGTCAEAGCVALQVDRAPPGLRARESRCSASARRMPEGPLRLAVLTGAPIVPSSRRGSGHRRYEVVASAAHSARAAASDADLDAAAQELADALEALRPRTPDAVVSLPKRMNRNALAEFAESRASWGRPDAMSTRWHIGAKHLRGAIAAYAKRFDLLEVRVVAVRRGDEADAAPRRRRWPRCAAGASRCRRTSTSRSSRVRTCRASRRATRPSSELEAARAAIDALQARCFVLRTPADVTPTALWRDRIAKIVDPVPARRDALRLGAERRLGDRGRRGPGARTGASCSRSTRRASPCRPGPSPTCGCARSARRRRSARSRSSASCARSGPGATSSPSSRPTRRSAEAKRLRQLARNARPEARGGAARLVRPRGGIVVRDDEQE